MVLVNRSKIRRSAYEKLENIKQSVATIGPCTDPSFATEERVLSAYDVCKSLSADEEGFTERLGDALGANVDKNVAILKQACNKTFCDTKGDYAKFQAMLTPEDADVPNPKICFADVQPIDLTPPPKPDEIDDNNDGSNQAGAGEKTMESWLYGSLIYGIWGVAIAILITVFVYIVMPPLVGWIIILYRMISGIVIYLASFFGNTVRNTFTTLLLGIHE